MPNKPKPTDLYDVASLSISNDPFIGRQRKEGSKYDAIFFKLKIGQRLVCHSDAAARLASQLKQWLVKRGHKNPVVRAVSHYGDGKGGVFKFRPVSWSDISQPGAPRWSSGNGQEYFRATPCATD